MGKGDKKTKKGKIAMGSYGNTRPHDVKKKETVAPEKPEKPEKPSTPPAPAKAAKK